MESSEALVSDPRLPTTPHKREAEEWALVLQAEGFTVRVARSEAGHGLVVPAADVPRALGSLMAWQAERATAPPPEPQATFAPASSFELALVVIGALALVAFQLGVERTGRLRAIVDLGENQAVLVLSGELFRTLTALTLHADLGHAVGNALFGGIFLFALAGRLGLGLAFACFLVTGTLGNLANAVYHGAAHSSIGASTGVFGLVGVLAGLAAWRRHQRAGRRRGAWVALGAGLAIVAMLGGAGPRIDLAAHLFGLAVGSLAGLALAFPLARRPRPGPMVQTFATLASAAAITSAWHWAAR